MSTTTYLGGPLDAEESAEPARTLYRDERGAPMPAAMARSFDAAARRFTGRRAPIYVVGIQWAVPPYDPDLPRVYHWAPYGRIRSAPRTTREDTA